MRMRRLGGFSVLAISLASLLAGCGGGGAPVPELVPVTGTVHVNGQPAAGVTVTFSPNADTKTTGASGTTGDDGIYKLMHRSGKLGVEPGKYTVTFSRLLQSDGTPVPPGTSPTDVGAEESIPQNIVQQADVPAAGGTFDFKIDVPAAKK